MSALKDVFARAEHWPVDAQRDLLQAALVIEQAQSDGSTNLDEDDYRILAERMGENAAGLIASDAEVEAVFAKYLSK